MGRRGSARWFIRPYGAQWPGDCSREEPSDEYAARIREGHFLQAHRPRETRLGKRRRRMRRRGTDVVGPPDVGRGDSLDGGEKRGVFMLPSRGWKKSLTAGHCFALQLNELPSRPSREGKAL